MLETTLKTNFIPGTNLTGGLATAAWRFLLPNLQIENIVCLEIPGPGTLHVLSKHCRMLTVLSTSAAKLESSRQKFLATPRSHALASSPADPAAALPVTAEEIQLSNQDSCDRQWVLVENFQRLPFAKASVDLFVLAGTAGLALASRHSAVLPELQRTLRQEGTIYFETKTVRQRFVAGRIMSQLQEHGFGPAHIFWVTPFQGELRTAFPLGDEKMSRYLLRTVLFGQSYQKRLASRLGAVMSHSGILSICAPRRAILMPRSRFLETGQAPSYLTAVAQQAGIDLKQHRCGLSARGKYNSNKTIFYFFEAASTRADLVVKMTRAPEFNARLENEHHVLALLEQKKLVNQGSFPRSLFLGYHTGLALMGQKAVHGTPFRRRTAATAQCPFARQALVWLAGLAGNDNQRNYVSALQVGEHLRELLQRFTAIYALAPRERDFLREQIKIVESSTTPFPLVFQHGDLGTWNMLVSAENKIIVIDWEAGDPAGMPLWDLFYFMRSFGNWCARKQGVRDTLAAFRKNFIEPSEIGALLKETVHDYCAALGLERRLAGPILLTCWMQRALKESARLTTAEIPHGHYANLLKLCIANYDAPALQAWWR